MSVMFLPRLSGCASRAGEAIVYPATVDAVMPAMTDFAVTVNGSPSPVYGAKIGLDHSYIAVPGVISTEVVGFTGFDITGPVTAVVTVSNRAVSSARVLPSSHGVTPSVDGNTITVQIHRPGQYELQINGSESQPLYLFANPREVSVPQAGANVTIYAAGVHNVGTVTLTDGQTVYLAPGAIVHGKFNGTGDNITIRGRGILDGSGITTHDGFICYLKSGSNLKVEGITITDSPNWTVRFAWSDNILVDNVKLFGYRQNTDGVDLQTCHDAEVKNSFIRTWDDGIVVKSLGAGDSYNIHAHNNVIASDLGEGSLKVGTETVDEIYNVLFEDNDVIHAHHFAPMTIKNFGASAVVRNVTYRDIRVEDHHGTNGTQEWFILEVGENEDGTGQITDITFENCTFSGDRLPSRMMGSPSGTLENVTFRDILYQREAMRNTAELVMARNKHAEAPTFEPLQAAPQALSVVSITQTIFSSDVTAHAVDLPATQPGDLLVMFVTADGNPTITTPSGWTSVYSTNFSTSLRGACFSRLSVGGASTTVDVATSGAEQMAAQVYLVRGHYGSVGAVVAGTPVVTNTGAGTTMPSVTPYVSGSALYIVALHWSVNYTATAPGGYANPTYTESGTTSSSAMLSTARVIKTVASESPGDYTMSVSGGSRVGGTICICSA